MSRWYVALVVAATGMAGCFLDLARLPDWGAAFPRFAVLYGIAFGLYGVIVGLLGRFETDPAALGNVPARVVVTRLLSLALVMRGIAVLTPGTPSLSDDVYRYLWEGRVVAAGFNPYLDAPDAPVLEPLRDGLWPLINHKAVATIYPPGLIGIFTLVNALAHTPLAMKATALIFDLALIAVLMAYAHKRSLPATRVLVYALNPLPIVEFAGNGHLDAAPLAALLLALLLWESRRPAWSAAAVAVSILTKYFALALLPVLWRARLPGVEKGGNPKGGRRALLIAPFLVAAAYLPFADAGQALFTGMRTYAQHWLFNASIYPLLYSVLGESHALTRGVIAVAFVSLTGVLSFRRTDPLRAAFILVAAFVLLSPTVHPWYVAWVAPFLVFTSPRHNSHALGLWLWTGTAVLAYHVLPAWKETAVWQEQVEWKLAEYLPVYAALAWAGVGAFRVWSQEQTT